MKKSTQGTTPNNNNVSASSLPTKVCMHVLREARNDVRAIRTATALEDAGVVVCIVDIESDHTRPAREYLNDVYMRHMFMPESFGTSRFEQWTLIKAVLLFIHGIITLIQTPAEVYHACEITALPACYIAARFHRKPLIFEAYELPLGDRPLAEMSQSRRWLHYLFNVLLAYILPRCSGVITVSPPIVKEIRKRYRVSKISLIRNVPAYQAMPPSDRLRQLLGLDSHVRIALYQGYLQPDRSLDILIRAAAFLEPDNVIVMMGKGIGTTLERLDAMIDSEKVADRVKIIPAVPYKELLSWTASADIGLLLCSPAYAPNIQMLLPNKLFEYLMAGLPVLSSELDAVIEVIRRYDVGQVLSSLAPADVGAAINKMLANHTDLARMHLNARSAAQHEFYWEKEKATLIHFYQSIYTHQL